MSQQPPNTNPDDTLPGFALSTFPEAYLGFDGYGLTGKIGDQLFTSPWAGPYDGSRLKPAAYQGADLSYALGNGWTVEAADMIQFENRTSSTFNSSTMLTSHPAGADGIPSNIYVPGGGNIDTGGFFYVHLGYAPKDKAYSANGYYYGVSSLLTMWWFDGKYAFDRVGWKPFVAFQGGTESNAGASYLGKIDSSEIGVQLGATPHTGLLVSGAFQSIPWHADTVVLPSGVACDNAKYQISSKGKTFAYFLPVSAGQCFTYPNGTTSVYYGGWASPYTDSYSADVFFTTNISQGQADRRAPGYSWKVSATYTSDNGKWIFNAGDALFNYGNALIGQMTNEWDLDAQYHFSAVTHDRYKGLLLRYRYAQRRQSNTAILGDLPLFKYNRAQLEYDF